MNIKSVSMACGVVVFWEVMEETMDDLRLCYVEDGFAWFTSHFEKEWGDDWNDAPYECNAGHPYGYHYVDVGSSTKERVDHRLVKVAYDGPFDQPKTNHFNSPYSVETINTGMVPWLNAWPVRKDGFIRAGSTLKEFIDFVEKNEGHVYLRKEDWT